MITESVEKLIDAFVVIATRALQRAGMMPEPELVARIACSMYAEMVARMANPRGPIDIKVNWEDMKL